MHILFFFCCQCKSEIDKHLGLGGFLHKYYSYEKKISFFMLAKCCLLKEI